MSSLIPHPSSFIPHPSSLFTVRTPTAIVTDLGTEFGVEVSKEGNTTSHVFRGSVKVEVIVAGGDGSYKDVVLRKDESVRVEISHGEPRLVSGSKAGVPPKFVRWIYEPPRLLDLLDIVAGGYGTGNRRECGIDPFTGMVDFVFKLKSPGSDDQYRPVNWHPFIDGVFTPDVRDGAVRLDSAGHVFDGFPKNTIRQLDCGSIWARAAEVAPRGQKRYWIFTLRRDERFMPDRRGLLGLHPNVGITFDMEAIRRAYPDVAPNRFRAVAGLADAFASITPSYLPPPSTVQMADFRVFVDGRLKLELIGLRPQDDPVSVDVELSPDVRFLTLVSTEGGGKNDSVDWFVLGDPVVQRTLTEPEKEESSGMKDEEEVETTE